MKLRRMIKDDPVLWFVLGIALVFSVIGAVSCLIKLWI